MKLNHLFATCFLCLCITVTAQTLTVNISGIKNNKGVLQVAVFANAKQFDDEKPMQKIIVNKSDISNGQKTVKINLKPGTYGITVLDDEDESGDMTYRFHIYPLEGVGFSHYMLKGLTKPDFSDFDFSIDNKNLQVPVEMKYF